MPQLRPTLAVGRGDRNPGQKRAKGSTVRAVVITAVSILVGAVAAEAASGSQCLELSRLGHTTAIDNRTIVAAMKSDGDYRKISLAGTCGGLKFHNAFGFTTPEPRVCEGQSITVIRTGSVCAIAEISAISAAEAETLLTNN